MISTAPDPDSRPSSAPAAVSPILARDPLPLAGRTVLVTGVSRRVGIGHAIACRAADYGASLAIHHYAPHDAAQEWGADGVTEVLTSISSHLTEGARLTAIHADLAEPGEPDRVLCTAVEDHGHLDALVCNQAMSAPDGALGELGEEILDRHWRVDARASILLAQAFAAQPAFAAEASPGGSIVFLTSGQALGPMPGEVAYAAAKAALAGVTLTIADQLAEARIRVNTVNPGPVDTGYVSREIIEQTTGMFPFGRWGEPDDAARLITWLLTEEARWITGQVIHSEGGFARWRR
ncbi:SDR family oxidoreductase [Actinomyces bowdenii]|uniref:SDR family oxidoreductase n=1 Tax=Actinomyces bowdenii TaxID=131109 RepID=UPI00214B326D|nr:SDR family oxidoreductase [Actinomyces bowdenii]MCR2052142.1 SDR family oxidoreductase [Actinomyces bowdenii]